MRFLLCFIFIAHLSRADLQAQTIHVQNGVVWIGGDTLCLYATSGSKKPTLDLQNSFTASLNVPQEEYFKDYIFSNTANKPIIYATAKVLSSPMNAYLRYYYKIELSDADTAVYIPYKYDCLSRFMETMAKYKVVEGSGVNVSNLNGVIQYWHKKIGAISSKEVSTGHSVNYNISPYNTEPTDDAGEHTVTLKGTDIYYDGILFGSYELSKNIKSITLPGTGKGGYYYYIRTIDGKLLGELEVANQYADIWVWPPGAIKSMSIYTAAREETKVIAIATKFLIVYNNNVANK